ncbi:MAG: hypothetical protein MH472_12140 [Bacteroidia bacterium]|nr:hypothetical protein [Bacteroidia bacterium]
MGKGFHTSMSYQFFILEFIANFAIYFSFWVILSLSINKWIPNFKMPSIVSKTLLSLAFLLYIGLIGLISISNPIFHFKRPYEWKILETGTVFIWQDTPRTERSDSINK